VFIEKSEDRGRFKSVRIVQTRDKGALDRERGRKKTTIRKAEIGLWIV